MRIRKSIERWFDIANDPDKARIKIKHLSPGEISDISNEAFRQKIDYKKKGKSFEPVLTQEANSQKYKDLTFSKAIRDWENFFDANGDQFECTIENIMMASREIEGFDEMIDEYRGILAEDLAEERGEQEKNLSTSASEQTKTIAEVAV